MKAEEKLMQECLQYFRERPVYEKVFQKMRGKYESLGHIGGKVVLTGLSRFRIRANWADFVKGLHKSVCYHISEAFEICHVQKQVF